MGIKLVVRDDLVIGKHNGNFGIALPYEFSGVAISNLRLLGGKVFDASNLDKWFIDDHGVKHVVESDGRQALDCRIDDNLVFDNGVWRVRGSVDDEQGRASAIKDECQRRIYSRWDQDQQWNALAGADGYTSEDLAECLSWVNSCRASRDALLNHPDLVELDVTDDQHWPADA